MNKMKLQVDDEVKVKKIGKFCGKCSLYPGCYIGQTGVITKIGKSLHSNKAINVEFRPGLCFCFDFSDLKLVSRAVICRHCGHHYVRKYKMKKLSFFRWLLAVISMNCHYCGCSETIWNDTPDNERPHWRIFCKNCGKRRKDLDGFTDRGN